MLPLREMPLRDPEARIYFKNAADVSSARPGTPKFFEDIAENSVKQWREEVESRNGSVLRVETVPVVARHNHDTEEKNVEGCTACLIEQRESEGRTQVRMLFTVSRDCHPVRMVEQAVVAKQHKMRGMKCSYHLRIQKKWDKKVAGQTCLRPQQEIVVLSLSRAAYQAIVDHVRSQPRH